MVTRVCANCSSTVPDSAPPGALCDECRLAACAMPAAEPRPVPESEPPAAAAAMGAPSGVGRPGCAVPSGRVRRAAPAVGGLAVLGFLGLPATAIALAAAAGGDAHELGALLSWVFLAGIAAVGMWSAGVALVGRRALARQAELLDTLTAGGAEAIAASGAVLAAIRRARADATASALEGLEAAEGRVPAPTTVAPGSSGWDAADPFVVLRRLDERTDGEDVVAAFVAEVCDLYVAGEPVDTTVIASRVEDRALVALAPFSRHAEVAVGLGFLGTLVGIVYQVATAQSAGVASVFNGAFLSGTLLAVTSTVQGLVAAALSRALRARLWRSAEYLVTGTTRWARARLRPLLDASAEPLIDIQSSIDRLVDELGVRLDTFVQTIAANLGTRLDTLVETIRGALVEALPAQLAGALNNVLTVVIGEAFAGLRADLATLGANMLAGGTEVRRAVDALRDTYREAAIAPQAFEDASKGAVIAVSTAQTALSRVAVDVRTSAASLRGVANDLGAAAATLRSAESGRAAFVKAENDARDAATTENRKLAADLRTALEALGANALAVDKTMHDATELAAAVRAAGRTLAAVMEARTRHEAEVSALRGTHRADDGGFAAAEGRPEARA